MNTIKTGCWLMVFAGLLFAAAGCNETHAQKKQAMEDKWQADSAKSKVPLIDDMIMRGDVSQAKKMLEQCLQDNPLNPHYHLLMGRVHFIEEHSDQARQSFQTALELDAQLSDGWYFLGSLAVLDKSYDLAIERYEKACELAPDNAEYVVSLAEVLFESGQVLEATVRVEAAIEKHSHDLDLMLVLAQINHQSGQVDQAVNVYEQAMLLHGNDARILQPCAYGYIALGQWANATRMFEKLLGEYQEDKVLYYDTLRSLAMCSMNCGRYGKAMDCYDELSVAFRDDSGIWLNMAQCALGVDDADQAIYYAQKALKHTPGNPKAYAMMASSYYLKGDYRQSLDTFQRITADDELAGYGWFMIGRCYQQMGSVEQAGIAYERAKQLDPESELMQVFLGKTVESL